MHYEKGTFPGTNKVKKSHQGNDSGGQTHFGRGKEKAPAIITVSSISAMIYLLF
jgi:hypothetical protein